MIELAARCVHFAVAAAFLTETAVAFLPAVGRDGAFHRAGMLLLQVIDRHKRIHMLPGKRFIDADAPVRELLDRATLLGPGIIPCLFIEVIIPGIESCAAPECADHDRAETTVPARITGFEPTRFREMAVEFNTADSLEG